MTELQKRLLSNKLRREHEAFVATLTGSVKELFTSCRRSTDINVISNLVLPTWENGIATTTKGKIEDWHRNDYPTWDNVKTALLEFSIPQNIIGWFTINHDGMHYEMSGQVFSENIEGILDLIQTDQGQFGDFSWVGKEKDFGIVFEYNHNYWDENEFEFCYWGI